jgi:hypothetical protein
MTIAWNQEAMSLLLGQTTHGHLELQQKIAKYVDGTDLATYLKPGISKFILGNIKKTLRFPVPFQIL